jgi:hypothetical protein
MTTLTEVLADLTDAGDIKAIRFSSGGREVYLLSSGTYDATPEQSEGLPASRRERERSRRIEAALDYAGFVFLGTKWIYDDGRAALWLYFFQRGAEETS